MKKFPVTSNGVEYCAEIVAQKFRIGEGVLLYLNDEKVYTFRDSFLEYKNDYVGMVKEADRVRKGCVRKLEEWDGECRE